MSLYDVGRQFCVAKHMKFIRASLNQVINVRKPVIREKLHISLLCYCPLTFCCCSLKYQVHLVNRLQIGWTNCFQQMWVRTLQRCFWTEHHICNTQIWLGEYSWEKVVRVSYPAQSETWQEACTRRASLSEVDCSKKELQYVQCLSANIFRETISSFSTKSSLSFKDNRAEHRIMETCTCWLVNVQWNKKTYLSNWLEHNCLSVAQCLLSYLTKYWTNGSPKMCSCLFLLMK